MLTYKKFSQYLIEQNNKTTDKLNELYQEQINQLKQDKDGRIMLAKTLNEAQILSKEQILDRIREYLSLENPYFKRNEVEK